MSSDPPSWNLYDVEARVIAGQPPAGFDCGRDAQNEFLYRRAWRDAKAGVSVTHFFIVRGFLAAYVTLMMDRIALGPEEKPKGVSWRLVPALKIAQLATDLRFAGHGLGRTLVSFAIEYARGIRTGIGCRFVTLEAEPDLVGWYGSLGFESSVEEQAARRAHAVATGRDPDALPVTMRFDLRSVRD